jgi:hypothetical protein
MKDLLAMSTRPLPHESGDRKCLKCSEIFHSRNAGNRICKQCRKINASLGPVSEALLAVQRGVKRKNGIPIEDFSSCESSLI